MRETTEFIDRLKMFNTINIEIIMKNCILNKDIQKKNIHILIFQ